MKAIFAIPFLYIGIEMTVSYELDRKLIFCINGDKDRDKNLKNNDGDKKFFSISIKNRVVSAPPCLVSGIYIKNV